MSAYLWRVHSLAQQHASADLGKHRFPLTTPRLPLSNSTAFRTDQALLTAAIPSGPGKFSVTTLGPVGSSGMRSEEEKPRAPRARFRRGLEERRARALRVNMLSEQ